MNLVQPHQPPKYMSNGVNSIWHNDRPIRVFNGTLLSMLRAIIMEERRLAQPAMSLSSVPAGGTGPGKANSVRSDFP